MKNWFLSNPYLIRLINQKLFTIVFSSLILLLKKNEYSVLLLQNLYLVQLFHIHTMIIFMHGSSSCYHQDATMTRSWFVKFDQNFNSQLPLWFIHWWTQFGLIIDIFSGPLTGSFKYFTSVFNTNTHDANC